MAHSIPESNGLIIRTALGTVLHTGDWKIDPTPVLGPPTDEPKLRALGDEGCLALVGDSTNAVREGRSPSETRGGQDARRADQDRARARRGHHLRVPCGTPALGRQGGGAPATARSCWSAAPWSASRKSRARPAISTTFADFRSAEVFGYLPPEKVVALCTGSQGEARAALSRIAEDDHPEVSFAAGDRVIFSSRAIPGNEKAVMRVINGLVARGVEVITDRDHLVHVSGHPRRAELQDMIGWVRPRIADPGPWRDPAHGRACGAGAPRRGPQGDHLPGRRSGAAGAAARHHRRGAGGPPLQGRLAPDRSPGAHRRGPPPARICRHRLGGARRCPTKASC